METIQLLWKKWLKIGKAVGTFQMKIFLTLFYYFILWMVGGTIRFFSDPLNIKHNQLLKSNLSSWDHPEETVDQAKNQY